MDRFSLILVVVISVVISTVAVVSGATSLLQEAIGLADATPTKPTVTTPAVSSADIVALKKHIAELEGQLVAQRTGNSVADWLTPVSDLRTENSRLKAEVNDLRDEVARLSATGPTFAADAPPADVPLTAEQVAALQAHLASQMQGAMATAAEQVFHQQREKERLDRRVAEEAERLERLKEAHENAEQNVARFLPMLAQRLELDDIQTEIVQAAFVKFEHARIDLDFQAWKEEWDRETRTTNFQNLWTNTQNTLSAAGLSQDQLDRLNGVGAMMMRGGQGPQIRGQGGPGAFGAQGNPQQQGGGQATQGNRQGAFGGAQPGGNREGGRDGGRRGGR